jgi:hypothetical protein
MKMKSYPSFDAYLADQPAKNQRLIRALRKFMRAAAPKLQEAVKWGNGCWLADGDKVPITGVYSDRDHVQFIFMRGALLKDPRKLLQGKGAYVRHIKVFKPSDMEGPYFASLTKQAIRASQAAVKSKAKSPG